jgi:hypothetical protein
MYPSFRFGLDTGGSPFRKNAASDFVHKPAARVRGVGPGFDRRAFAAIWTANFTGGLEIAGGSSMFREWLLPTFRTKEVNDERADESA